MRGQGNDLNFSLPFAVMILFAGHVPREAGVAKVGFPTVHWLATVAINDSVFPVREALFSTGHYWFRLRAHQLGLVSVPQLKQRKNLGPSSVTGTIIAPHTWHAGPSRSPLTS
jgi:hypothetical protein